MTSPKAASAAAKAVRKAKTKNERRGLMSAISQARKMTCHIKRSPKRGRKRTTHR